MLFARKSTSHNSASAIVDRSCWEYEMRMITLLSILGLSSLEILFCLYVTHWEPLRHLVSLRDSEVRSAMLFSESRTMFIIFVTPDTSSPHLFLETMSRLQTKIGNKGESSSQIVEQAEK